MRRFFYWLGVVVLFGALIFGVRHARAYDCLPTTAATPLATGTSTADVTTPAGTASGWWCLLPRTADDVTNSKVEYGPQFFVVLNKYRSSTAFAAAAARVGAASDAVAQAKTEVAAATIVPAPGSQDEYDFNLLKFNACTAMITAPIIVLDPIPAGYCGPPPVSPAQYLTAPNGTQTTRLAYNTSPTGGFISGAGMVPVGVPCDCTKILHLGSNPTPYCTFTGAASPSVVTACVSTSP